MSAGLKVVRLHRFEGDTKLKAFCDISIGDFLVKGLKVVEGSKGLFISMPQEKSKDGKYYPSFSPLTEEAKHELSETVLAAYNE